MRKKTLWGWILECAVFCIVAALVVIIVRLFHGSDILAGGLGAVAGMRFVEYLPTEDNE